MPQYISVLGNINKVNEMLSGDIEGKFWFAVQPSDDGEYLVWKNRNRYVPLLR